MVEMECLPSDGRLEVRVYHLFNLHAVQHSLPTVHNRVKASIFKLPQNQTKQKIQKKHMKQVEATRFSAAQSQQRHLKVSKLPQTPWLVYQDVLLLWPCCASVHTEAAALINSDTVVL